MDVVDFARYFAALAVVLGLLGLLALGAKQGWLSGLLASVARGRLPVSRRERRLQVVETLILDPRRRLVMVRHDDEEVLLMLGPNAETVVDRRPAAPVETPSVEPQS
tara:strand:- start:1111 stop:1431 length:321 start_codon:yes stop_codon:yes gene_type:complete